MQLIKSIPTTPFFRANCLVFITLLLSFFTGFSQQKINLTYNKPVLKEDFNEENKNWNYQTTYENFFVVDKGDLFLNRLNPTNPYAFISNWENPLTTFQIRAALKLAPEQGKEQTIGIIFLVQKDGNSAVVMEFNRDKEYRIKKLVSGKYYKYLSGSKENQGWVKTTLLSSKDEYNELDIRVKDGQIDFYINKKFVNSFTLDNMLAGNLGMLIGPNTKARIDYFNVYGTSNAGDSLQNLNGTYVNRLHGDELIAKQQADIDSLKAELRNSTQNFVDYRKDRDLEYNRMKELLDKYIRLNDSLEIRARKLTYLEDEMLRGIDNDLLLTLTTELREQIRKNQNLEAQVEGYKDSIFYMNKRFQELKVKLLSTVIEKRSAEVKAREEEESKLKKPDNSPKNDLSKALPKDQSKTTSANTNDTKAQATNKSNARKKEEDKAEPEIQAPTNDLIKPNPRSKNTTNKVDSTKLALPLLVDSMNKEPKPIPSRVKKAKKGNRQ